MFTDGRSRKVVFVAHCLLNQNSISDGTAVYPAAFREVVETLLDAEVGILVTLRDGQAGAEAINWR